MKKENGREDERGERKRERESGTRAELLEKRLECREEDRVTLTLVSHPIK